MPSMESPSWWSFSLSFLSAEIWPFPKIWSTLKNKDRAHRILHRSQNMLLKKGKRVKLTSYFKHDQNIKSNVKNEWDLFVTLSRFYLTTRDMPCLLNMTIVHLIPEADPAETMMLNTSSRTGAGHIRNFYSVEGPHWHKHNSPVSISLINNINTSAVLKD